MVKKRGVSLFAALAFATAAVDVLINKEKIWFGIIRLALYAAMALLLFFNRKKALKIPLSLLVLIEVLCIIPYSYKLTHKLAVYFEQPIPSWWDIQRIMAYISQEMMAGISIDSMLGWLGIGTMNLLNIECIGAIVGVAALLVMLFSKNKTGKKSSWILMMVCMVVSGFAPILSVAYFLTYCAIKQEV